MKIKVVLSIAAALLAFHSLRAADITTPLPSKCEAFRPDILYTPLWTEKDVQTLTKSKNYGQSNSRRGDAGHEYWIVFSDRANNATYVAPGSNIVYKKLDFNEKVRIAQIKNGWALVYYEPKEQETYPKFSGGIEWKGWIKMDNLLLWSTCPANEKGIYNKAVLCANIDVDDTNGRQGKCYHSPDDLKSFQPTSIDFTYYFVMKKVGTLALLSFQNTMNGISYKVLYGWVDENSFVAWNQRSCLEPNWDPEERTYFNKNGVKAYIYDEKTQQKASYITYDISDGPAKPDMYRMNGNELRYPILDADGKKDSDKYWHCSTFSSPGGGGAINANTTNRSANMNAFQKNLESLSHVNLAFVMDGTKSMEAYFPAVRKTLMEIGSFFDKSWKVKVGFLIYRDKADGNFAVEYVPMTDPGNTKMAEKLEKGGDYGIRSGAADRTMEEALFYGIDTALDVFQFNPDESNLMFVIGDCGDAGDYPEITEEGIARKLQEKDVTLMGFQVRNEVSSPAFATFNANMTSIILTSLRMKYKAMMELDPAMKDKHLEVKVSKKKSEYVFSNTAKNEEGDLFIGSHKNPSSGVLPADELSKQIMTALQFVKANIDHQMEILNNGANNVKPYLPSQFVGNTSSDATGPELDEAWLRMRLGAERYNEYKNKNLVLSFRGYTLKKDAGEHEFYKTVIFISQQELATLLTRLQPLYEVCRRQGNDREPYVKAMKALIQSMLPNLTDEEINAKGYDEVMAMVAGLNVKTNALKGRTITEMASTSAVSASEYQAIIGKFKRQYDRLRRIQQSKYLFVREFNGAKYYWIPTEDLP